MPRYWTSWDQLYQSPISILPYLGPFFSILEKKTVNMSCWSSFCCKQNMENEALIVHVSAFKVYHLRSSSALNYSKQLACNLKLILSCC
ncbi:hypothetical protein RDI58_000848 [Solanum bulbocastanum]|uniref:Uncharacterized protein n=1 Tax=Solanum bulbocastanum TaxID=147425 RepID=A0AAN8U409_SOLBU